MIEMHDKEFKRYWLSLPGSHPWYYKLFKIVPRAFTYMAEIYINVDAYYYNAKDKKLLILHEWGHVNGEEHTLTGIMADNGFVRYITS